METFIHTYNTSSNKIHDQDDKCIYNNKSNELTLIPCINIMTSP